MMAAQVRAARVDQVAAADRLAPEEHAKAHQVARGQRDVDLPALAAPGDESADHRPELTRAIRALDVALVVQRRLAGDRLQAAALERQDHEADGDLPALLEQLDTLGVQRGAARARVDLGLDAPDAEIGQLDPLAPAHDERLHARPRVHTARRGTRRGAARALSSQALGCSAMGWETIILRRR